MNGFAGSSRQQGRKQELAALNGAVPASTKESGDPAVGLAVRIVETFAIDALQAKSKEVLAFQANCHVGGKAAGGRG
jgi:hypothetical protein